MKNLPRITATALLIGATFASQAQTISDADRRARNREEAIAHHNGLPSGSSSARSTNQYSAPADDSARAKTHRVAEKTRGFTHRQAEKARHFGARTNAKYPAPKAGVEEANKAPTAQGK